MIGKMGIGRILNGELSTGDQVAYGKPDEPVKKGEDDDDDCIDDHDNDDDDCIDDHDNDDDDQYTWHHQDHHHDQ